MYRLLPAIFLLAGGPALAQSANWALIVTSWGNHTTLTKGLTREECLDQRARTTVTVTFPMIGSPDHPVPQIDANAISSAECIQQF